MCMGMGMIGVLCARGLHAHVRVEHLAKDGFEAPQAALQVGTNMRDVAREDDRIRPVGASWQRVEPCTVLLVVPVQVADGVQPYRGAAAAVLIGSDWTGGATCLEELTQLTVTPIDHGSLDLDVVRKAVSLHILYSLHRYVSVLSRQAQPPGRRRATPGQRSTKSSTLPCYLPSLPPLSRIFYALAVD